MLTVTVVERSAETRKDIVDQIHNFLRANPREASLLPRLNIKSLTRQELKFHAAPSLLIVGEEILTEDLTLLGQFRKLLPQVAILVRIDERLSNLSIIEQLARYGADDTYQKDTSATEFFRKLIILARKAKPQRSGTLILVDSSKGGQGITSITAALGEALVSQGKRTLLVDLDLETQDLTRFLQVRPCINENLQGLLEAERPITQEFVEQALVQVWADDDLLWCMPPPLESDESITSGTEYSRTFFSIFEILDALFEYIVVDLAQVKGSLQRTLYRIADKALFVVSNDPAGVYAAVNRITKINGQIAADATLHIIENSLHQDGVASKILRHEITKAAGIEEEYWVSPVINYCRTASRWPGSGGTLFSCGKKAMQLAFQDTLKSLGVTLIDSLEINNLKLRQIAKADSSSVSSSLLETITFNKFLPTFARRLIGFKHAQINQADSAKVLALPLLPTNKAQRLDSVKDISKKAEWANDSLDSQRLVSGAKFN